MADKLLCEIFGKCTTEPEEPKQGRLSEPDATKEAFLRVNAVIPATRERQTQYMELLLDYHDVISIGKFDLGWTDALQQSINMEDEDPVHTKQFRIPLEHRQTIYDWVDELVEKGAIETSKSPYNSPIFLVPKPHGPVSYTHLTLPTTPYV